MGFFASRMGKYGPFFVSGLDIMQKLDPVLNEKLTTLINAMGYELIGCELVQQGGRRFFRIYIDKLNGVTVDDCSAVSRQVSSLLDVFDPIKDRYSLEVSSPGVDRPLFNLDQYQKQIGKLVKVRLYTPIEGRRQYKGRLRRIDGEDIYLSVNDIEKEVRLPFSIIEKGNVISEIGLIK